MRYTKKDIENTIINVNAQLERLGIAYRVAREGAYGGHAISKHNINDTHTGRHMLTHYMPARECYRFVFGMYQVLDLLP